MHRHGPVIKRGSGQAQERTLAANAELVMVVVDQLTYLTGIRATETFFEPLQLHLQTSDLLEQLSLLGLPLLLVLGVLAPAEQLAGSVQQLPLPLAHLDRVDGVVGGDLLDCLAATDRLHGDPGFELGAVGEAFAHPWEPPFQGRYPATKVNDGACPEKPVHLRSPAGVVPAVSCVHWGGYAWVREVGVAGSHLDP